MGLGVVLSGSHIQGLKGNQPENQHVGGPPIWTHTHKKANDRYCIKSGRFWGCGVLESNLWIDPWDGSYACVVLLRVPLLQLEPT